MSSSSSSSNININTQSICSIVVVGVGGAKEGGAAVSSRNLSASTSISIIRSNSTRSNINRIVLAPFNGGNNRCSHIPTPLNQRTRNPTLGRLHSPTQGPTPLVQTTDPQPQAAIQAGVQAGPKPATLTTTPQRRNQKQLSLGRTRNRRKGPERSNTSSSSSSSIVKHRFHHRHLRSGSSRGNSSGNNQRSRVSSSNSNCKRTDPLSAGHH
mmetsp:Transcript_57908/g.116344  ORF Transcript_57908/g.116344 Transcript_57908/m.116344 type:complete len:211 (+) Transcript_57908:132-764(+)